MQSSEGIPSQWFWGTEVSQWGPRIGEKWGTKSPEAYAFLLTLNKIFQTLPFKFIYLFMVCISWMQFIACQFELNFWQ